MWLSGDFYSPDIEWQTRTYSPTWPDQLICIVSNSFWTLHTQDHNLSQTVSNPTHLHHILDLFFTNFPALIQKTQVMRGLIDHDIVMIESNIKPLFLKQANRKISLAMQ